MGWQVVYVPFLFAGDTIIEAKGIFVYSSTPALGNLIASIAPQAGTDDFNNPFNAGINAYVIASGVTYAIGLNLLPAGGEPGLSVTDLVNPPFSPAGLFAASSSSATDVIAQAEMSSGETTNTDVAAIISALSQITSALTGGLITLQASNIQFTSNNGQVVNWTLNSLGVPQVTQSTGDTNVYKVGKKHFTNSNVTVSTTTAANLLNITNLIAGGAYHIKGWATYHGNQAAGAPIFSWGAGSGLVLGSIEDGWQRISGGGNAPVIRNNAGALASLTGFAFAASTTSYLYEFDIYVSVITGGGLLITGAENTAGDSFVIDRIYAFIEPY